MPLTKMTTSVNNIQGLQDRPNEAGMTSSELKETFDKAGSDLKDYLNTILTEELDSVLTSINSQITTINSKLLTYKQIYPVGAIYLSVNNTNPGTLFPGTTWTQITGRFLLASGGSYSLGATGGEATHKLTASEIPAHTHGSKTLTGKFQVRAGVNGTNNVATYGNTGITSWTDSGGDSWSNITSYITQTAKTDVITINATHEHNSVGGSGSHNNMPPYLVVSVWKRTA